MKRDLWAECPPCSSDSPYGGRAEWDGGHLYGLFDCPQCGDYFAVWRPAFEALLAEDAIDSAGLVHDLAERLCRIRPGDSSAMEAAVAGSGIAAALEAKVTIDPAPSPCATVELELRRWSPQFGHLEARFGPADTPPRTGPGAAHFRAWTVAAPDAPSEVSVFAYFPPSGPHPFSARRHPAETGPAPERAEIMSRSGVDGRCR